MSRKNVNVGDKRFEKSGFYKNKKVTRIDDIDVNKILVSKEEPYGTKNSFKYFIRYNDNDVISFHKWPAMLENLKVIQQFPLRLAIEFDSKPVHDDNNKYIKTKIKIYTGSVITNFQGKKVPKEKGPCKCLPIIMLDSVMNAKKNYYPQTLLKECKYEQEKIKMENVIDDDLEKSSSDESGSEPDNDKDNDESNK